MKLNFRNRKIPGDTLHPYIKVRYVNDDTYMIHSTKKYNFVFVYATKSRPELFKQTYEKWNSLLSGKHNVQWVINVNTDDVSMKDIKVEGIHYGDYKTKIEAMNANI